MSKTIQRLLLTGVGILAFLILAWMFLALIGPFRPDSFLFGLQHQAEVSWGNTIPDAKDRVAYYLGLVDRRANDLSALAGESGSLEMTGLTALNDDLDLLLLEMTRLPREEMLATRLPVLKLVDQMRAALATLQLLPIENELAYQAFSFKIKLLRQLMETGPATATNLLALMQMNLTTVPGALNLPGIVSPGQGFIHNTAFPLEGAHSGLACGSCHPNSQYLNQSVSCETCHSGIRPADHFNAECSVCHSPTAWSDVQVNHVQAGFSDCQSCHSGIRPSDHAEGQCSQCHTTTAWLPANVDHSVAGLNCQSCHEDNRPKDHYAGQCSTCHTPGAWIPANFDHVGAVDCQGCHTQTRPVPHYRGQCSSCHSTAGWLPASFSHATAGATDCAFCHAATRPTPHYSGTCSLCHTTLAWIPANFNHTGALDCQNCHQNDRPANHYPAQCSACHNPAAWLPVNFNHAYAGSTDCQSCHAGTRPANHYAGQCSTCHTSTTTWTQRTFNHTGYTDCQSCHAGTRPANHYAGQCSNCHTSTTTWTQHAFNHTGYTDCQSCHESRRPANHYSGQCSSCHTSTTTWTQVSFNHTFPLNHQGANGNCATCHPNNPPAYTCYGCHNRNETVNHHAEKGINDIDTRCATCHPTGSGGGDRPSGYEISPPGFWRLLLQQMVGLLAMR
jgi:hypothetical protein